MYCLRAALLLDGKQIPFEKLDCSDRPKLREWLVTATGRRTVPQIFIGGVPIGGFDDLRALERSGALEAIVRGDREPESIAPESAAGPPPLDD
jgi:glutaredoxin 3